MQRMVTFSRQILLVVICVLVALWTLNGVAQEDRTRQFHVFPLQHKQASNVEKVLRPLLPKNADVQLSVDSANNQLLVSGGADVKRLVEQFLQAVDIPEEHSEVQRPLGRPVEPRPRDEFQSYRVPVELHEALLNGIASQFGTSGARVQAGPQPGTLLVMAPAAVHRDIQQLIESTLRQLKGEIRTETNDSGERQEPARLMRPNLSMPPQDRRLEGGEVFDRQTTSRFFPVSASRIEKAQREIVFLFQNRLSVDSASDGRGFLIDMPEREPLGFRFDFDREGVVVRGDDTVVAQFGRLIQALAKEPNQWEQQSRVIRLQREVHESIPDVLQPRNAGENSGGNADRPERNDQSRFEPSRMRLVSGTLPSGSTNARQTIPPFQYAQDPVDAGSGQGSDGATGQDTAENEQDDEGRTPLQQFEGVEIDSLPDLDVIILRGRDQELEQLSEIIRQLERISQETQAEIRIVNLQHTSSSRINQILAEANQALVVARQGRVAITPLIKPNSLLLIGWGEAVEATVELIDQLDVPVDPDTQYRLFRLRHANVTELQQTVNQFFSNRQGLGTEVRSTVDSRTNSLIVYASPRDLAEVASLIERLDSPTSERVSQARIFPIQYSLAADVAQTLNQAIQASRTAGPSTSLELMLPAESGRELLRSGILENISVVVDGRNNALIISGPEQSFGLIEALIDQLDTPGVTAKIKIFPVINGDAGSMVETLRALIPSQTGAQLQPQLSSAPQETSLAPLRFTVDVRSNSVIATGSEGDLKIVEALILRLDESGSNQRQTMVYQLKNSPAIDVALAINEFLRSKRIVETATPGEDNPFQEIEKEVVVVPEPVRNKLILSATPRYFKEIEELIEQLDEQPPEVIIQVLIAEVTLNEADEFGIELGVQDSVLFDRSLLSDLLTTTNSEQFTNANGVTTLTEELIRAATNTPGFDFNSTNGLGNSGSEVAVAGANNVGSQGISNFGVGRSSEEVGFGGLVLSASSQNVSVLVRALQESRRLEILSRPQVRTLDNQPAFIQVGQRVPRIVSATVNQNGQSNNVELENVGLILGVTPRISPDGNVVMEIDAEKSNLGPEIEGIPVSVSLDGTVIRSPRVDTTTAQASVSAASGETIILGGLITKQSQDIHRRVPVLGDVPLIGNLFRFDSVIDRRTELLIILTPHVIRTAEDNERIKQTEIARMSWCSADVYDIHGDIDFIFPENSVLEDGVNTDVIYPDVDPSGGSSRRQPQPLPAIEETPGLDELYGPQRVPRQ